jgi:hypothetical protein
LVDPMMAVRRALCKTMSYYVAKSFRTVGRRASRRIGAVAAVALFGMVAMNGCGGGGAGPSGSGPGGGGSTDSAASPSLELASQQPSKSGAAGTYTGMLGSDAIEGGCAYLQAPDGRKYEVLYPDGWTLRKSPLELIAPDGQLVARAGEEVTVRGSEADMASICQIGPIIRASEVVIAG